MATALPALSPTRRLWLMAEMALLYLVAPMGVYVLVYGYGTPLFMVLLPVFVIFATILTIDGDFIWRKLLTTGIKWAELAQIIALFLVAGAAIAWFAWKTVPGLFLLFPRRLPELWLIVMVLYPLISVTTQEIMFRVFFFHRYGGLFGHQAVLLIWVNAALFTFAHIIFQNWISIWISLLGGLLFAWRYHRTRSFWAVTFEHALYGNLIFTVGLGRYFFTGMSNFN
ncbi:MAG: CPBP family intramembrane glutamic endopeptidase [Hyphomicrobiaceae bacterium]